MSDLTASLTQPSPNSVGRRLAIPHAVLGVLLFVVCEVMFFGGLISAYLVGSAGQSWPPADQPRLPVITTLFNTVVLLCSGWFMYRASLPQRNNSKAEATSSTPLAITSGDYNDDGMTDIAVASNAKNTIEIYLQRKVFQ